MDRGRTLRSVDLQFRLLGPAQQPIGRYPAPCTRCAGPAPACLSLEQRQVAPSFLPSQTAVQILKRSVRSGCIFSSAGGTDVETAAGASERFLTVALAITGAL